MREEYLNFAVGPVMMEDDILQIGKEQIPYFRTAEFSDIMKENERLLKELSGAGEDSRVVFLTGSGTAGMEMAVMNFFSSNDKTLVVNGGGFGKRFQELCELHDIPFESIVLSPGEPLTEAHLEPYRNKGFTGMLINMHETSTGVLYDMELVGEFCKENGIFLVVDAISAFLADKLVMEQWNIDVLIVSSQKALALPPGMSFLILSECALKRVGQVEVRNLYFRIADYLKDGERGQTPYTPAVSILLQLNARLRKLAEMGVEKEVERVHNLAVYFRENIKELPFRLFTESPSNAVTSLVPTTDVKAYHYFERLDKEYNIWVCPNGGDLADMVFRVGHIGDVDQKDYDELIAALYEIVEETANGATGI